MVRRITLLLFIGSSPGQINKELDIFTEWHSNGQKKSETTYKNNNQCCKYTEWRENGQKKMEGFYLTDNGNTYRDGLWICWYKNGKKRSEVNYKYDFEFGECIYYNIDGAVELTENYTYVDDVVPFYQTEGYSIGNINPGNHPPEDGIWEYNGPFVSIKTTYRDWEKNGQHREWTSQNGVILTDGNYKNEKKDGLWTQYRQGGDYDNSTGIKLFQNTYKEGNIDGLTRKFYRNGEKESEGYLKGTQKIGLWTSYLKDGSVLEVKDYDNNSSSMVGLNIQKMIEDDKEGMVFIPPGEHYIGNSILIKNKSNLHLKAKKGTKIISRNTHSYIIKVENSSNITIENFYLTHYEPRESYACEGGEISIDDSDNIDIINCDLNGSGSIGVKIRKSQQVSIKNCFIHDNTWAGVLVWSSSNITIMDNSFERNGKSSKDYLIFQSSSIDDVYQINNSIIKIPVNKYY